jgi:hypothetical protein
MLGVAVGEKRIRARSRSGTPSEVSDRRGKGPSSSAPSWGHNELIGTGALMPGVVGSCDDIQPKCGEPKCGEPKRDRSKCDRSECERFACERCKRRLGQCNPGGVLRSSPRLRLASPTPEPAARPSGGYRDDCGLGRLLGMVLVLSLKHRSHRASRAVVAPRSPTVGSGRTSRLHGCKMAGNHTVAPIMPRIVSEC